MASTRLDERRSFVDMAELSRALDEIYAMRRQAALEVEQINDVLSYRTLPGAVRDRLIALRTRLIGIARGAVWEVSTHSSLEGQEALESVGAKPTLVRAAWKQEWQS